jgi:hypothetical protein
MVPLIKSMVHREHKEAIKKNMAEKKIGLSKNKIITRSKLYKNKTRFHKEQARLPFEEKIEILVKLQTLASGIKGNDKIIWKI